MAGTVASLIFGVILMAKGGGLENGRRQNKLMTYRIYFQAAAILLLIVIFGATK